jgi:hypothetical protein
VAEHDKYERDRQARIQRQALDRGYLPPDATSKKDAISLLHEPSDSGGGLPKRKPLTLASAPSVNLLNMAEQTLCMQMKMLPRPFIVIKETLIREFARRGGRMRKKDIREVARIDPNRAGRIWDLLVTSGVLKLGTVLDVDDALLPPNMTPEQQKQYNEGLKKQYVQRLATMGLPPGQPSSDASRRASVNGPPQQRPPQPTPAHSAPRVSEASAVSALAAITAALPPLVNGHVNGHGAALPDAPAPATTNLYNSLSMPSQ